MTAALVLEVAFAKGPNDALVEGDWTDLSDRILGFSMDRGRDDRSQTFDPGTVTFVLDNEDRMLDPAMPGSLVDMADGTGMPLCPLRVSVDWAGDRYRIFTGYVGLEPWVPLSTRIGGKQAVRLDGVDKAALMASEVLPTSPFAAQLKWLGPHWWVRGLLPTQVTAGVAEELADSSGNGRNGEVSTSVPGNVIFRVASMVDGDDDSAMTLQEDVSVYSDDLALTAATAGMTMCCVWRGTPDGVDQEIMRQRNMTSGHLQWRVECQTTGTIVAIVYDDTTGTPLSFIAAPSNLDPDSSGRWDDDVPHIIFVRVEGGSRLRIWVDGRRAETTSSIPSSVRGRVIFGGGSQVASFDEAAFWTRAVSTADIDRITDAFTGVTPFEGDSFEARLQRWWDLTGLPRDTGDLDVESSPESPECFGIDEVPGSLLDALEQVTGSVFGALWVDRSGVVRARTRGAWETIHATAAVALTDDPGASGTPLVVRRSQPQFTGIRLDRVVNVVRVSSQGSTFEVRNDESITRYGERSMAVESVVRSGSSPYWFPNLEPFQDAMPALGSPAIEVEPVVLWPLIDAGAAEWIFTDFELEQRVELSWVDGGWQFTQEFAALRESWTWDGDDLQVQVALGAPYGVDLGAATSTPFADSVLEFATEDFDVMTTESGDDLTVTV